jgi:hypothetical protein
MDRPKMEIAAEALPARPVCEWIEPGLREIAGQDPLGLQTITTDRILPALLPGVLALSRRARYLSIYSFLLRNYQRSAGQADNTGLDGFIRRREFELTVAANLCSNPQCTASGASGNLIVRPLVASAPATYERALSIRTPLGGYGLYYRSPMEELGLIIPAGSATVDDEPTPIDLLSSAARAQELADAFEEAVAETRWYRDWMRGVDPIPADVLEELAAHACLCRLSDYGVERERIARVLLDPAYPERAEPTEQRRRAFALFLDTTSREPNVASSDGAFRREVIGAFERAGNSRTARGEAQAQWAAMAMRECVQDAISSIWHHFCRAGLSRQPFDGYTRTDLDVLITGMLPTGATVQLGSRAVATAAEVSATDWIAELQSVSGDLDWEDLREVAAETDDAVTGLAVLVLLCSRTPDPEQAGRAWAAVAQVDGAHQPGLGRLSAIVGRQGALRPTVAELLRWTVRTFIVAVHETVAMSKLPASTFRFYWEHGRLRFVDNGIWRFDPSGLRRDALATIAFDLGWWRYDDGDVPGVTNSGRQVIDEVFES